jgi:amino acid transporter
LQRNALPDATSKPSPTPPPRRWTIFAAALLLFALALVVLYTSRRAFSSPLALVVVAAIGLAALLLQLRLRKNQSKNNNDDNGIDASPRVRSPLRLNALGVTFALAALAADILHWTANAMLASALGAVVCFAISATAVLHALRKK